MSAGPEVYSLDEIARAAYVDLPAVEALVARGRLRFIPETHFVSAPDAVAAARALRAAALLAVGPAATDLFCLARRGPGTGPRPGWWSLGVHAAAVVTVLFLGRSVTPAATPGRAALPNHLIFLVDPGPGGGGGGGGAHASQPATPHRELARQPQREALSVPEPAKIPTPAVEPEPLPSRQLLAPVAQVAASTVRHDGAIDAVAAALVSAGSGADGGAGTGRTGGNGPGTGLGLGDGANGGTGGNLYRPGGVEPPRLLKEVKGIYSEEARRANVTGDVVMEVVVRADGTVASARVTRGLGYGLDERAVAAVQQWRFAPARRAGQPVDVAVEVAMEFNLR